jgi:metal-responsive CopG/Arc/MetJ family transcriptional regulator
MAKVNLPDGLAEQIDIIVKNNIYGFKSRDEFIRESVRNNLHNYQLIISVKEDK